MKTKKTILNRLITIFNCNLKTIILSAIVSLIFNSSKGQSLTTWWYKNGIPDSVYYRTDIASFKCIGGVAYTGSYDTTVIDSIVFHPNRRDKANDVFFKSISTLPQRIVAAQTIYNSGLVEIVYLNVSKTNNIAINTGVCSIKCVK